MRGLSEGYAHFNRDGIVSLQELCEYVEPEVVRAARALGGNSTPSSRGNWKGAPAGEDGDAPPVRSAPRPRRTTSPISTVYRPSTPAGMRTGVGGPV